MKLPGFIKGNKLGKKSLSTIVAVLVVLAVLAANVALTAAVWNNDLFLDLTETKVVSGIRYKTFGLYTLREAMTDVLDDIDAEIGNTRIVCNQLGYVSHSEHHKGFKGDKYIEL